MRSSKVKQADQQSRSIVRPFSSGCVASPGRNGAVAEFRLTPRAEKDLEEIWRYSAKQWSIDQADTYVGELLDAMNALALDPASGRPAANVRPGYRRRNCGSHVIFYRVARNGIEVVRVLHLRMDIESHFP